MAISERVDLVGNVSSQARKWARDLAKLSAQAKALNKALGGTTSKPRDRQVSAEARAERAKAAAIRAQARATAQAAREQAKLSKAQFGPTRRDAHGAMMRRQREQAQAAKATARAQATAAREQARAANAHARAAAKAPMFGPGRREAGASAMQRQREQARAAKETARAEAAALKQRTREQEKFKKSQERLVASQIKDATRRREANAKAGIKQREQSSRSGFGNVATSALGNFAADAAMNAMSTLAGLMQSMAGTFVQAQKFREQSLAGLTILQKSGSEAKKTWDESFKLARDTGSTQQETMASIQTLMATGFKKGDAVELYKLMSALSVVNPQANMEGIVRAISQIKNTGRLQGDELMQLADAGVSTDAIYKALGKRLGKTNAEIRSLQEAGKISADDAIWAIKEAAKSTVGGDVEGVLKGKANSLGAIMSRLQAAPMTFFSGLEQDPALMERMKGSLSGLVDLLDPSTEKGKKAAGSFAKMIDAIAGPGADLFAKMADGAPEFLESITKISTDLAPIVSLLGMIASAALKVQSGIASGLSALAGLSETIWTYFNQAISQFSTAGSTMASNLVNGLVSGIFGGQSAIVSAITTMAHTAIGAGNAAFAIRSPSRVFAAMGEMLPAGLARGVEANMAVVEQSARNMASGATTATQSALPFIGKAMADVGAGAVNKTISMGGVRQHNVFQLGSERDGAAAEISALQKRMIQAEIQAFFGKAAAAA